jgi:hypothetical protein
MSKIKIASARLSFPSLFTTAQFSGEDTGKYEATFILDKVEHAETIKGIQAKIDHLLKNEIKGKLPSDKICLKDGDESGRHEFEGKMTIKASTKRRPLVINRDKSPITAEDNIIYAGCYVHAIISLWAQQNSYGKRINASLDGVQFARDGEPFGDGGISANEFDAFGEFDDDVAF